MFENQSRIELMLQLGVPSPPFYHQALFCSASMQSHFVGRPLARTLESILYRSFFYLSNPVGWSLHSTRRCIVSLRCRHNMIKTPLPLIVCSPNPPLPPPRSMYWERNKNFLLSPSLFSYGVTDAVMSCQSSVPADDEEIKSKLHTPTHTICSHPKSSGASPARSFVRSLTYKLLLLLVRPMDRSEKFSMYMN